MRTDRLQLQRAKWTTQCACRAGENPHPQSHARALRRHVRLIPAQGLWLSRLAQHGLFGTHDQWHGNGKTHVVIACPGTRAFPSSAQLRRNRSQGPQSHPFRYQVLWARGHIHCTRATQGSVAHLRVRSRATCVESSRKCRSRALCMTPQHNA